MSDRETRKQARAVEKRNKARRKKRERIASQSKRPAPAMPIEEEAPKPKLVPQKRTYSQRRRLARLRNFLIFITVVGLSIAGSYYLFPLQNIDVIGNEVYDDTIIARWVLNEEYSWNTLYSYLSWKFNPKGEIPFVESVELSIENRTTLCIEVYEKATIGCIYDGASATYAYFDKDGIVSEMTNARLERIPEVFGLECNAAELYKNLTSDEDDGALNVLLNLVLSLNKADIAPDTVTFQGTRIDLTYKDVTINFGNSDYLAEKTQRLAKILPYILGEKGTLHMENWSYENTDIVFSREN